MIKMILACVPFGCDNIGDEAILECAVKIMRRNFPDAQITAATRTPTETAKLLNIKTVGLLGFDKTISAAQIDEELKRHDVMIWTGATGLSDYPNTALNLVERAQNAGLKVALWGVGMDSKLNPAFFTLAGKKLMIAKTLTKIFGSKIDFTKLAEQYLENKARKKMSLVLKKCSPIILRDPQSLDELYKCPAKLNAIVGADSAIELDSQNFADLDFTDANTKVALLDETKKIGVCISAQREVKNMYALVDTLDKILDVSKNRKIIFIPMNPLTDAALMRNLQAHMKNAAQTILLQNCKEPAMVQEIAKRCDVVLSSRLHLLILSANVGTPIVGISRGSKLDNFLSQFGLKCAGSVDKINTEEVVNSIENALKNGKLDFEQSKNLVYKLLKDRLHAAERELCKILNT